MVYGTSNGVQNDIGNYLGPCNNIFADVERLHGEYELMQKLTFVMLLGAKRG